MKMKRVLIAVLIGVASMSSITAKAQISINVNIGQQPAWGPTGYDHVDYYYLPDVDAYYYVPGQQYVYQDNGAWVWRSSLPSRYSGYDLYSGYKVVMNTPRPYLSHQTHITQYSRYKNYGSKQSLIRDSRDAKYVNARKGNYNKPAQSRPNQSRPAQVNSSPSKQAQVRPNQGRPTEVRSSQNNKGNGGRPGGHQQGNTRGKGGN
ncbi:hypothetical protein [Pedobacter duraquae]|uniref:YXWGXW repeat-containing protein n=1 Tax=Pedobacter duraquae TaxID=425511 RepID=A0A4R6IHP3_9SPHI|nr:hypothetical protein [Pedobacter duraquae]TDO20775.1 hypothetical protein CLV32_3409 [Pedobacter duraquae]